MCHQRDIYHAYIKFLLCHDALLEGPNVNHQGRFAEDLAAIERQEIVLLSLTKDLIQKATKTIMRPSPRIADLLSALLIFVWYQYWTRPQQDIVESLIALAEKLGHKKRALDARFCLAQTLYALDKYHEAHLAYKKAGEGYLALELSPEGVSSGLGMLRSLAHYGPQFFNQITENIEEFVPMCSFGDKDDDERSVLQAKCQCTIFRADLYVRKKLPQTALTHYNEAAEMLIKLKHNAELAYCRYKMAQALGMLNRYDEALKSIDEAISLYCDLNLKGRGHSIFFYLTKARCLQSLDQRGGELSDILAFALKNANAYGSPLAIAKAHQEWAEVYLKREDWLSARLAFSGVFSTCAKMNIQDSAQLAAQCGENLRLLKAKEHDPNRRVAFLRPIW